MVHTGLRPEANRSLTLTLSCSPAHLVPKWNLEVPHPHGRQGFIHVENYSFPNISTQLRDRTMAPQDLHFLSVGAGL